MIRFTEGNTLAKAKELPDIYKVAFEQFLAGSSAPHPVYAYQHDYERFLLLIEQGKITIEK
ncbi:hypothetical protein [Vibrio splendidus]|uniref:hypothetical protein n=1 Tax=Vibrio splendidus TaxID=29497 RepID=UPI0006CA4209|nr:hypothetical protein [Vibrio splendidus]KPL97170.1 hypothetical protein AN167_24070 [Vibrio splendidus]